MDEQPIVNFAGELVALGPMRRDLLPLYWRWRNDFTAMRHLIDVNPVTFEQEAERYDHAWEGGDSQRFLLYDRASLRPIGIAAFNQINHHYGSADYSIVIGEAEFRSRGYGTEATRLLLDYAFTALGLNSVQIQVYEYNPGAIRAYEKAGFRISGRRRQAHLMGGRLWDVVYMDCLAGEFESPVLEEILAPDAPR